MLFGSLHLLESRIKDFTALEELIIVVTTTSDSELGFSAKLLWRMCGNHSVTPAKLGKYIQKCQGLDLIPLDKSKRLATFLDKVRIEWKAGEVKNGRKKPDITLVVRNGRA
jgi:hypothetical protein